MEKEFGKVTRDQLKKLFASHVKYTDEREEFKGTVAEKSEKLETYLKHALPWSYWYELPFNLFIVIVLDAFGLRDQFMEAARSSDPQQAVIDLMDEDDEPDKEFDDRTDEEKGYFFSLYFALDFNIRSLRIFSKYLNQLVSEAKNDDEALFDAVLIDPLVVSSPSIAKRIQKSSLENDKDFFQKLAKSITKTRPRRPEKELDDTRLILAILNECKSLSEIPPQQMYEVITKELRAYPGIDNNTYETFRRFYHRHKKTIGT